MCVDSVSNTSRLTQPVVIFGGFLNSLCVKWLQLI